MKTSTLLWGAAGSSAVWLLAGVLIFVRPAVIGVALGEFGGYLQGVFAPVAFLWVVIAVILQSTELANQRTELELTRKEFENSRAVMAEQVEEARRQADLLQQQTHMLKEQDESRQRALAAARLREVEDLLEQKIRKKLPDFMLPRQNQENSPLHFRAVADNRADLFDTLSDTLDVALENAILPHNYHLVIRELRDLAKEFLDTVPVVDQLELQKGATANALRLSSVTVAYYDADPGKI